jgi:heme-degrading monooxygenase HmoA
MTNDRAIEHWQAQLLPIAHRGECNHLERTRPGLMFEPAPRDPGGPLFVLTTAGFDSGPGFDMARVIDFRRHVDLVRAWLKDADGRIASQVNTPHERGDDGMTMSVWRSDAAMFNAAYKSGEHRTQIERYQREHTADRTSFTRFRMLGSAGLWAGRDPLADARAGATSRSPHEHA